MNARYLKALQNDSTVYALHQAGHAPEDIVAVLFEQKQALLQRLFELENICPKRYLIPDGHMIIWHCPDNLIPITELFPSTIPAEGLPHLKHENT